MNYKENEDILNNRKNMNYFNIFIYMCCQLNNKGNIVFIVIIKY